MKKKKREPKFKLGQVVMTPIGFRGIIISIKGKRNIKYIVLVDGNFGNHKISEKKLLKLNPISGKPKEPEN